MRARAYEYTYIKCIGNPGFKVSLKKSMLEKEIEKDFKNRVERLGGFVWKFVSPGLAGVPDRIVLIPGGRVVFAECKAPGKKLRPLQVFVKKKLESLGFDYWVIDAKEKTDRFIRQYFGR